MFLNAWVYQECGSLFGKGSQCGQVGYAPDFLAGSPGSTPAQGNLPKKTTECVLKMISDRKVLYKGWFGCIYIECG